jgi:peptidoglycan/xylan/chitin deacetylase (PgdA/CDA1 family)
VRGARALRAGLALALAAALLAGCADIPDAPAWSPRDAEAAALSVTDQPADGVTTASATPVSGLDVRLLYNADPASPVAARWGEVPGNQALTDVLRDRVRTAIAEHSALTGVAYVPAADAPAIAPDARGCLPGTSTRPAAELLADPALTPPGGGPTLTISCEIIAAAGTVLVEALRITTASGGAVTSDQTTVYYAETSGAFVTTSDTLLSDEGLKTLLRQVVQSLKVRAGALQPEMMQNADEFAPETLRATFSHFSFATDGSLVVHLPAGFTTPELDLLAPAPRPDPAFVTVPAADAAPMLGEVGRQIQSVLASGAPLALPPAPWRGAENVDCRFFACVALTFDDGPGSSTSQVLDDLDARRAAATFFLQGIRVGQYADEVRRMKAESHEIGNHTWNHPDLTKLPDPEIADQLGRTNEAIRAVTGQQPTTFRPPYGAVDARVLLQTDLPAVLWTVDTNDWQLPDDDTLLDRAVGQPEPGAIILMHDVHENTARMVPAILDGLLGRGYTLVTVQQLLGGVLPAAHTTVSRG